MVETLKAEYQTQIKQVVTNNSTDQETEMNRIRANYFKQFEHQLTSQPYGNCILANENIAAILECKLLQYHQQYYKMICFAIMPNHVHMLVDTSIQFDYEMEGASELKEQSNYVKVSKWMQLIKGGSSFLINKALGTFGAVWAQESFDRVIRDERDFGNVYQYIVTNYSAAGLSDKYQKSPYLFINSEYIGDVL